MNRSVSAQDFIARRHGLPDASPGGAGTPGKSSPVGPSHHTPTRQNSHHHRDAQHPALMGSALRVAIAVIIIFATGCTVGSVLRLEYYLHRTKAHAGTFLDDPQASLFSGRVIKRTHQVWAVRTETYQNHNAAAATTATATDQSKQQAAGLAKQTQTGKAGSLLALANSTRPYQPARLQDSQVAGATVPAAAATATTTATATAETKPQAQTQAQTQTRQAGLTPEAATAHEQQLLQQLHQDQQQQQQQQQAAQGALSQQPQHQIAHPHAAGASHIALRYPSHKNAHVTRAMEAALAANQGALPVDFDWRLYLAYYPDLTQAGITTENSAKGHYVMIGRNEKRLYRPLAITLRYTACGGLMNQHYSHLAALALGVVLNANVVVPPALSRNSFLAYFSQDPSKNKVTWSAAPTSSMWDTAYLHSYWSERGINITEAPHTIALPDMTRPESAYPTWLPQGYSWDQVARLGNVYLKALDMGKLAADALHELALRAIALKDPATPLLLDLPCTLFMLDTTTAPHLVPEVARALRFAPGMHTLAQKVLAGMAAPAAVGFNGLHLRMEADAKDWAVILGGRDQLFRLYVAACQRAAFGTDTGMYLASGMFTYKNHSHTQQTELQELKTLSSRLYYKELYLQGATDLAPLTNEQQALIDFLVLAEARHFVGISVSTFSYFLREYRLMRGLPASTSTLVDGSRIGTERLFHQAGRVMLS